MLLWGSWFSEEVAVKSRDYTLLINIDKFDKIMGEHCYPDDRFVASLSARVRSVSNPSGTRLTSSSENVVLA
ncbi:hypothetical protein AUF78_05315 [archaeon 13_1_20CM_2_51_12]|nr:MAG: hypothetical protein AUF78_05315 [archaeon 13_1_20CM_2_51_12]